MFCLIFWFWGLFFLLLFFGFNFFSPPSSSFSLCSYSFGQMETIIYINTVENNWKRWMKINRKTLSLKMSISKGVKNYRAKPLRKKNNHCFQPVIWGLLTFKKCTNSRKGCWEVGKLRSYFATFTILGRQKLKYRPLKEGDFLKHFDFFFCFVFVKTSRSYTLKEGFFVSALLTFRLDNFLLFGNCLCIERYLIVPAVPCPSRPWPIFIDANSKPLLPPYQCDNQKCLPVLLNVPWVVKKIITPHSCLRNTVLNSILE